MGETWVLPRDGAGGGGGSVSGLTFRETMSGPVALGASDPETGAVDPDAATLAVHCEISIDDIDRFVDDREHTGSITGSVEYEPFGGTLPVSKGIFNLKWIAGSDQVLADLGAHGAFVDKDYAKNHGLTVGSPLSLTSPRGETVPLEVRGKLPASRNCTS